MSYNVTVTRSLPSGERLTGSDFHIDAERNLILIGSGFSEYYAWGDYAAIEVHMVDGECEHMHWQRNTQGRWFCSDCAAEVGSDSDVYGKDHTSV